MCISSSSSSLSSLAPLAIVSANESTTSNFKKIKTLDSRPSSNSLSLIKLPSVLIAEIFSYSSINVRASCSMRLCHGIQNLLLNIGSPHCILDVEDAKLRFNNEIAKRFINNRNFKIIRDIDFRGTKVKNPTDIFTHQMLNLKTLFIAESLQSNEEEEKEAQDLSLMLNSYCPNLTHLDIQKGNQGGMEGIFKMVLPSLENLRLAGQDAITKEDLSALALNSPKLKILSLQFHDNGCNDARTIDIEGIAFSSLKYLNLYQSTQIIAQDMVSLVASNPQIDSLNLSRSLIDQEEFDQFVYPPKLTDLDLSEMSCDDLDLSRIACQNLKTLDIYKIWNLTGHALFVQQNPSLEVLTMSFGEDAPDLGLTEFIHLKNLHTLTVFQHKNFTTELTLVGKSCPSLRSLIINCEEGVGIEETTLTKELINSCNFPLLTHLRFPTYGCDFEEGVLELLPQKFPNLSLEVLASIRKKARIKGRILENVPVMTEEKEEA